MRHTTLQAILEAREQRWRTKQDLARRFRACVLSLCLNIPGPDKSPPGVERAFALLQAALREAHALEFQRHAARATSEKTPRARCAAIIYETNGTGADGTHWLMASPLPGSTLKRMAVRLEYRHPLGRLADIDILTQTGESLSRADLGLPPRRCFLCDAPAMLCRRRKQHPQEMLINFTTALLGKM